MWFTRRDLCILFSAIFPLKFLNGSVSDLAAMRGLVPKEKIESYIVIAFVNFLFIRKRCNRDFLLYFADVASCIISTWST